MDIKSPTSEKMIQLQFFTSIKKIEDRIKTLYDQHSCIINLETENINSNKLIVYAENYNLPTYKVLEASFIIGKTKCAKKFRYGFQFSAGKNRSKITKFKHSLKMI